MIKFSLFIIILFLCNNFGVQSAPIEDVQESSETPDVTQWSSVPELDEGSMMTMLNSVMEMLQSKLSSFVFGSMSNDEVEVDQSSGGFMNMIHGMFSRLSNIAMDMMGQMRRIRDKSIKERLTESNEEENSGSLGVGSVNGSTLATRLKNQMDQTKERIKDVWNNLMQKYKNGTTSRMMMDILPQIEDDQLIDNESKANKNLASDNKRVIRSVTQMDRDTNQDLESDVESRSTVLAKLITMDEWLRKKSGKSKSKQFEALISRPDDTESDRNNRNIFDRMRGAMDNARSKFLGAIGKFMNGSMMNNEGDDDRTNMTEDEPRNWWSNLMPKDGGNKKSDREPLNPRNLFPTKATHPIDMPKTPNINNLLPMIPPIQKPVDVDWPVKLIPSTVEQNDKVDSVEQSKTTIEFMDKFKSEMEMFKTSMDGSNDNIEMAMEKLASWGLFVRGLTESKNLDDFWGKLTQQN